jgi:hypothetical protein
MIELLIENLIAEGKVSREEIDAKIIELKSTQPPVAEDLLSLKNRQGETENAIVGMMDMILMGGM